MVEVTERAKEKLKEVLLEETTNPRIAFRITPALFTPTRFWLTLDSRRMGDTVVTNKEGIVLLLMGSDVVPELEGMVLDYQETFQESPFAITEPHFC